MACGEAGALLDRFRFGSRRIRDRSRPSRGGSGHLSAPKRRSRLFSRDDDQDGHQQKSDNQKLHVHATTSSPFPGRAGHAPVPVRDSIPLGRALVNANSRLFLWIQPHQDRSALSGQNRHACTSQFQTYMLIFHSSRNHTCSHHHNCRYRPYPTTPGLT